MKRILLIALIIIPCVKGFSQFTVATIDELKKVKTQELLVILSSDLGYNAAIRDAMEKYWKFGSYRFINSSEAAAASNPDTHCFLIWLSTTYTKTHNSGWVSEFETDGLALVTSVKKSGKVDRKHILAWSAIDPALMEASTAAEVIRDVQVLNNFCEWGITAKNNGELSFATMYKDYPGASNQAIHKKTLLIAEGDLNLKKGDSPSSVYKHPIQIVSREKIAEAIISQDPTVAYLCSTPTPQTTTFTIHAAATSKVLHVSIHPTVRGFTSKVMEDLSE